MILKRDGSLVGAGSQGSNGSPVSALPARRVNGHGLTRARQRVLSVPFDRRALSVPLDRLQFSLDAGLAFNGYRDYYLQLGYTPTLTYKHYRTLHRRGGIGKRVIEAYPKATWAADPRLTEDADNNTRTPFEAASDELFDRLGLWSRLERTDILANVGRYACMLIGAAGALDTPLPSRLKQILYLQPLSEEHATVESWDDDTNSPRYGLPLTYRVYLGDDPASLVAGNTSTVRTGKHKMVHQSRILHVAEGLLEDDVFGTPRLEAVWNNLDDLLKVVGGGSEAAWKRMDPGMQMDIDPEMPVAEGEIEAMEEQVDEYVHGLRRVMQTRGTKMNLLSTTVAGFGPNATAILQLISGTTGIPQRILTGSERGELASTQDRDNWWDRINERRRTFAVPLIRELVDRLIERGALPAPKSVGSSDKVPAVPRPQYLVTWPEVGALDSAATAEIINKLASANQSMFISGGGIILTADEIRHHVLGLGPRPAEADIKKQVVPEGDEAERAGTTAPPNDKPTSDAVPTVNAGSAE